MASFTQKRLPYKMKAWEDEEREAEALRLELAKLAGVDLKKYSASMPLVREQMKRASQQSDEPPKCVLVDPRSALSPDEAAKWTGDLASLVKELSIGPGQKKATKKDKSHVAEKAKKDKEVPIVDAEPTELPKRRRAQQKKPRMSKSLPKLTTPADLKPLNKALFGRLPVTSSSSPSSSSATSTTKTAISGPLFSWPDDDASRVTIDDNNSRSDASVSGGPGPSSSSLEITSSS